jgi:dihydrodipicolinate synthase/N-acetylneuraminate lyase
VIAGTLAATATPLRPGGVALDEAAIAPLAEFLAGAGLDGVLVAGTLGEGILLTEAERRRATERFVEAGNLTVIAHCGAQTTAETVALARHAADAGADGVAVIAPPYFPLGHVELLAHFAAAAVACAPLPFYVYEFERASGYAVPLEVLANLRELAPNFAGLKVSDAPWDAFSQYLIDGLDVFVGPEALIHQAVQAGAVGAVSALAAAFPERVAAAVREGGVDRSRQLGALRTAIDAFPRHAALKHVLRRRGVPIETAVRAPLRELTGAELRRLDALLESEHAASA